MKSSEIRLAFETFWNDNKNHAKIENVSLIPVNDPTILFTNSGMFPLVPYLLGEKHPKGTRLFNFQRCLRTSYDELEEIGDNRHTLMFEMMGNWSLGDYFKEEQIPWIFTLYTKYFKLDPNKLFVSVFAGDDNAPRDTTSIALWQKEFKKVNIHAEVGPNTSHGSKATGPGVLIDFNSDLRIFPYAGDANWWQRGDAPGELGGPDSEIFYDTGRAHDTKYGKHCHINCDCGRFIEIGNNVFMQYKLDNNGAWKELVQKNIDFGGGFERIVMISQNKNDIFETDLFWPIIQKLEDLSGEKYISNNSNETTKNFRIIADHIRGSVFILADGITPSNKDQGYILRSLIRRMIRKAKLLNLTNNFTIELAKVVIKTFKDAYPHLLTNQNTIINELEKEEIKFASTITKGIKELQKLTGKGITIDGKIAFNIYETYGFPIEMIIDEISDSMTKKEKESLFIDFDKAKESHRKNSRKGAEQKFKGGLLDSSTETTALHTTHHLLLAALQQVLGSHIKQKGSNITADRLRIDFSHNTKLTASEVEEVENIVNKMILANVDIVKQILPKSEAEKLGAQMEFGQKYGDMVNVYSIKNIDNDEYYSIEFCGGPHVSNTKEIQALGLFKITKQKNIGSGLRRIKGILTK